MRTYEIRYVDNGGHLIGAIFTARANSKQASIFAHAMKLRSYKLMEVWDAETLVYERPLRPPVSPGLQRQRALR
jgi:hypothetical protein